MIDPASQGVPQDGDGVRILSTKFSTDRHRRFQIRTDVLVAANGEKQIRKTPLFLEGQAHVNGMLAHCQTLAALYAGSPLAVNACRPLPDGVAFEFLSGPTLADVAQERLLAGNREGFLSLLAAFFDAVHAVAGEPFRPTPGFQALFGSPRLPANLRSAPVTNLDLILPNVIVHDGHWHVIDYEWTFDFPIPVGFVLFRTLRYLFIGNPWLATRYGDLRPALRRMAGIGREIRAFQRMELALQLHIAPPEVLILGRVGDAAHGRHAATARLKRRLLAALPGPTAARLLRTRLLLSPSL